MALLGNARPCTALWTNLIRELRPQAVFRRCVVTIQRGKPPKLDMPENTHPVFWSQIQPKHRPDRVQREIVIHDPPPSSYDVCKDPVLAVAEAQRPILDPTGARTRLFDRRNSEGAKVGDVLHTTFKSGEPFSGAILSIRQRGINTSVLLRNHITRIGAEMHIKVFSPLVRSMEIAQRTPKRKRRARLYYMRQPKHDMGSVQKIVDQYLRQKAALTGGKFGGYHGASKGGKGSRRK